MPKTPTDGADHGMIKPPKRTRRARVAAAPEPAATPAPPKKAPAPKPAPEKAAKAEVPAESTRTRRPRNKPKIVPKEVAAAPNMSAPKAEKKSEHRAERRDENKPTNTRRQLKHHEQEAPAPKSERPNTDIISRDGDGGGETEDKPRRRSRRGGRGRKRNGSEGEATTQPREDAKPERKPEPKAEERAPRERREEHDDDAGEKPRRRSRRGGRSRRSEGEDAPRSDREQRSEPRESRDSRERSPRPPRNDEPVTFDADAEFDPDVFADRTYDKLPIRNSVLKGIHACGFNRPTHIQDKLIPVALDGKDVLGQAKTGTGKTAAFSIPMLCKAERGVPFQTLILAPTRELAIQITAEIKDSATQHPSSASPSTAASRFPSRCKTRRATPRSSSRPPAA